MGQRPKALTPDRSPQHRWGAELRATRTERGLSLDELGRRIHRDRSYLAKIERGERSVSAEMAQDCDRALDTGGSLVRMHTLVTGSTPNQRDNSGDVANTSGHVASPAAQVAGQPPQPEPWETADDEIAVPARTADGRVIFVAVSRRSFLRGVGTAAAGLAATPAAAQAAAPPASLASAEVHPVEHLEQVRRTLIDADNLFGPSQVLPTVHEKIKLIQQIRGSYRGADQKALLRAQTQFAEFAGWLHQDSGDQETAQHWLDRAFQWSHGAGDSDLTTFILARKAQLAGDMAEPLETVDLADAAEGMAGSGSRLAVIAATFGAHGHALRGDRGATLRGYDHARDLLDNEQPGMASGWAPWMDSAYIDVARFRSLALVGDYRGAAEGFQQALAELPTGFHRDRGVYLARAAAAHAGASEIDQATTLGLQALSIGVETRSGRILTELDGLNATLAHTDAPPAREFREAMHDTLAYEL